LSAKFLILRIIQRDIKSNQFLCYSYQIIKQLQFSQQIFGKYSSTKFHKTPYRGSRNVPCGRTDRQADMTQQIVTFRNFANAPIKETELVRRIHTALYINCRTTATVSSGAQSSVLHVTVITETHNIKASCTLIAKLRFRLALISAKRRLAARNYPQTAERIFMKFDTDVFNEKLSSFFNLISDKTLLYRPLYMKIYIRLCVHDQFLSLSIVELLLGYG